MPHGHDTAARLPPAVPLGADGGAKEKRPPRGAGEHPLVQLHHVRAGRVAGSAPALRGLLR
eukprot:6145074-Pyramimonas_sp.AAC.1